MPKLSPDQQLERRTRILNAAERCFARSGFHRTTMQDICSEAGVSAGALYGYFDSKEDLIAGIAERDRSKLAGQLAELANAPDLVQALAQIGEYYTIEEPQHKRLLCIEIGLESTRNETVGKIFRSVDSFAHESFENLLQRAVEQGRIKPDLDAKTLAAVLCVIGDGMFWRRAVDPDFEAGKIMPALTTLIAALFNPGHADATDPFVAPVSPDEAEA